MATNCTLASHINPENREKVGEESKEKEKLCEILNK